LISVKVSVSLTTKNQENQMKMIAFHGFVLSLGLFLTAPASAGIVANGHFSSTPNGSNFDYTIALNNTGTTNVGTFWFAWIPEEDFMLNNPISVTNPTGWTSIVTGGFPGDGYAIQWVASTNAITPGNSLNFHFTSAETPTQLAGNSPFFGGPPEALSYVYIGGPETDPGFKFLVTPAAVPEPSSMILVSLAFGGFGFGLWTARRKKAAAVAVTVA
jgi:hypothetical protein